MGRLKKKHKLSAASLQFDKLSYGPRQGWTRRFFHSLKHAPGRLGRPQGAESGPAGWREGHDLQKCRLTGKQQFLVLQYLSGREQLTTNKSSPNKLY